jgi:hypothetical protein
MFPFFSFTARPSRFGWPCRKTYKKGVGGPGDEGRRSSCYCLSSCPPPPNIPWQTPPISGCRALMRSDTGVEPRKSGMAKKSGFRECFTTRHYMGERQQADRSDGGECSSLRLLPAASNAVLGIASSEGARGQQCDRRSFARMCSGLGPRPLQLLGEAGAVLHICNRPVPRFQSRGQMLQSIIDSSQPRKDGANRVK